MARRYSPALLVLLVLLGWMQHAKGTFAQAPLRTVSLVGVVMDSRCATTGSHEAVMKQIGARDPKDCTLKCAKNGSFVLYVPETKKVYQLSDQDKPAPFAGEKVKVTGKYDNWSETIEIQTIEPANET